jgi:hypothetical protein
MSGGKRVKRYCSKKGPPFPTDPWSRSISTGEPIANGLAVGKGGIAIMTVAHHRISYWLTARYAQTLAAAKSMRLGAERVADFASLALSLRFVAGDVDLPRFRGVVRAWDQSI